MNTEEFLTGVLARLVTSESRVTRAMTAEDFLRAHSMSSRFIDTEGSKFGRLAREQYEGSYGEKPPQIVEVINGRERPVYIYPHGRQDALRYAWSIYNAPTAMEKNAEKKK